MAYVPECSKHLEVDVLEDVFWSVKLDEEHDEDAVIWQLLEF